MRSTRSTSRWSTRSSRAPPRSPPTTRCASSCCAARGGISWPAATSGPSPRHLDEPPAVRRSGFQRMVEQIARGHRDACTGCRIRSSAGVHGAVAGFGLSLMNACDLVVAADDAYFAVGVSADRADAGRRRLVVAAAARGHAQGDGDLPARRALRRRRGARLGIVNKVVPAAELDAVDRGAVPARSPRARACAAQRPSASSAIRWRRTLSEQLQAEAVSFGECTGNADFVEGITAFLAKRPPQFGRR